MEPEYLSFNANTETEIDFELQFWSLSNKQLFDKCFGFCLVAAQAFCRAIQLEAVSECVKQLEVCALAALQWVTFHFLQPLSFEGQFRQKKNHEKYECSYGSQNHLQTLKEGSHH